MSRPLELEVVTRAMLAMPWSSEDLDPVERADDAAKRLKMDPTTLRRRARKVGLVVPGPGRPTTGTAKGLRRSEWDLCDWPPSPGKRPTIDPTRRLRGSWTPEEDAILRRLTKPKRGRRFLIPWPRLLNALPGRGKAGIRVHRRELGLTAERGLPEAEMEVLRAKFGRVSRKHLLRLLPGRRWSTLVAAARSEGLSALPAGHLLLSVAAKKFGYHVGTFKVLLARHGVVIHAYQRQESYRDGYVAHKPWRHVRESACARAVALDCTLETVAHGADRVRVPVADLRAWMVAAGHPVGGNAIRWLRFAPKEIDRVVAERRASMASTMSNEGVSNG